MWIFDPKFGIFFAHKIGQNGVHWGVYRANFGFLRVPFHLGTEKISFGAKTFSKKMHFWPFFESHFGHLVCKMGPNGAFWGV